MESKAVLLTGYSGKKEGFGAVCLSRNQENHEPCEWLEGWRKRRFFKRARGATAKCNVDDKWRVETRCQNDGTAEGNDMIVRWTRRMFAVLRFPPSIPGPVEGPSYLPLTDLALLLSSLSLFFLLFFFFIYTHAAIGNFTLWFDQFNFHHYQPPASVGRWFRIRRHHRFLYSFGLIFFPCLSFPARGPPRKGEDDWRLLLTVANGGVNWA